MNPANIKAKEIADDTLKILEQKSYTINNKTYLLDTSIEFSKKNSVQHFSNPLINAKLQAKEIYQNSLGACKYYVNQGYYKLRLIMDTGL